MRGHAYGPHDPETAPVYIDLANGKGLREVPADDLLVRPRDFVRISPGGLRQRRDLNNIAHERTRDHA